MRVCRLLSLFIVLLLVQSLGAPLLIKEAAAVPLQSGLIRVALTKNVAPRNDWSNGTLYHLKILQKFIPVSVTVITSLISLSDYQVLFLNMLNISDADISAIRDWVNGGGFLVCIGQSGRYTETGVERTSHPLATVLGITLNDWERRSGVEVRKLVTSEAWHWWSSGRVYDPCSAGDQNRFYPDRYYIPKSECVHATPSVATEKMACRDVNNTHETTFVTYNTYGSGRAFFIAADAFYRIVWKSVDPRCGLYDSSKLISGGEYLRRGLLWQILYAIMLDFFPDTPIVASMPNGVYTAMNFYLFVWGGGADNDTQDDLTYGNCTQHWEPLFRSYPALKGWFWGFAFSTAIINGTSNATNICKFIKDYGYAGSRGHVHVFSLEDFIKSSENLWKHNFSSYKYGLTTPYELQQSVMIPLVEEWNFLNFVHITRMTGYDNFGAEISCIPYPNSDHTWKVLSFVGGYARETGERAWFSLINGQKTLGQYYGIGGFCTGTLYDAWTGSIPYVQDTIETFIGDDTVWKTSEAQFHDWWIKRWKTNITDYSADSTQITVKLQTPSIEGLTLLLRGVTSDVRSVTVDGASIDYRLKNNRIIIPQLSQGAHEIQIKFGPIIFSTTELKDYNEELKMDGKPYIISSTHVIKNLTFAHQRLSTSLDVPSGIITEIKVYSTYPPFQIFANGKKVSSTYTDNIASMLVWDPDVDIYYAQPEILEFRSTKLSYRPNENVELILTVKGSYSTPETIKWLVNASIKDRTDKTISTTSQELELNNTKTSFPLEIGNFTKGTYTITVRINDPETQNTLATKNLAINVTEIPIAFLFIIIPIIMVSGITVLVWYRRKKKPPLLKSLTIN